MTIKEQEGYELIRGIARYLFDWFGVIFLLFIFFNIARIVTGFGMDDSDSSSWHRSGLVVLTDAKTGIQYLSDGRGGLVRRAEK